MSHPTLYGLRVCSKTIAYFLGSLRILPGHPRCASQIHGYWSGGIGYQAKFKMAPVHELRA
jgi:hypothetical protein